MASPPTSSCDGSTTSPSIWAGSHPQSFHVVNGPKSGTQPRRRSPRNNTFGLLTESKPRETGLYQLLWHLGGSQTDIASLTAEAIDWANRTVNFPRKKNHQTCAQRFGDECAAVLENLPKRGCYCRALPDSGKETGQATSPFDAELWESRASASTPSGTVGPSEPQPSGCLNALQ